MSPRSLIRHCVVPVARNSTGRRQLRVRVRKRWWLRNRQPWRPRTFATDTYTRVTPPGLAASVEVPAHPRSEERPRSDSPPRIRRTPRRESVERGAITSRHWPWTPLGEPGEPGEPGDPGAPGDPGDSEDPGALLS